jgi:transposase-like protein
MKTITITQFNERYPDDDACLHEIFINRNEGVVACPRCGSADNAYYKVKNRKCYECKDCGNQLHPLAGTIFHKSSTPLKQWFYAVFLFSKSKNGISAKELERQLGVTYKTAWRMAKQIRLLFDTGSEKLDGVVEMDETYIGGVHKGHAHKFDNKTPVVGAVERNGGIIAKVTQDASSTTLQKLMREHVSIGTKLYTDDWKGYTRAKRLGYLHKSVNHSKYQWTDGLAHTNTIEGFWSQLKRSIRGTYGFVSPKYLQTYLNEFSYRYNHRTSDRLFEQMISLVVKPS